VRKHGPGHEARHGGTGAGGCGDQDVLNAIPNRVKFSQQLIRTPKTLTEEYFDPAAEKSEETTCDARPIGHAGVGI